MSGEPHDLVARLLRNASEPQHPKSRGPGNGTKSKASKENRSAAAKGKPKSAVLPLDRVQLERLFDAAENTVFAPRAAPPPPSDAGCQGAALLRRLTLDPTTTDLPGSPMSIERPPRPAADGPGPSPLDAPAVALAEAAPSPTVPFSPRLPEDTSENNTASPAAPLSTQEELEAFNRRCLSESQALLASCPSHLVAVHQTFPKQAEAFTLADQCNAGLPLLPPAEILMAPVGEVPRRGVPPQPAPQPAESAPQPPEQASQASPPAPAPKAAPKTNPSGIKFSFVMPSAPPAPAEVDADADAAEENERKRQRAESDGRTLREIKDAYAAALAQFNAPQAAAPAAAAAAASSDDTSAAGPQDPGAPHVAPELRNESIRVFCVERLNDRNGQFYRSFAATSYAGVWRSYLDAAPGTLHWYEVIRESRPCHLYFDLEFARDEKIGFNTDVDGDALVDTLIHHVGATVSRNWGIALDSSTQVYELDSSTPEKFSRHLIVRLPGYAFLTNAAAGHTAAQAVAAAGAALEVSKAPPPSVERACFVDMAVYSRNRHFRLAYSSKGGKAAMLRPTNRYATAPGPHRLSPAVIFSATLICNVEEGAKLLAVLPPMAPGLSGGGAGGRRAVQHTGDVVNRVVTWKRAESEACDPDQRRTKELKTLAEKGVAFVERVASQRAKQDARARTVAFCGNDGLVAYSMIGPGSHYCENIRRDHRNNHVYFVLNFAAGCYAQKCHDPDCSRFRSPWMPLSPELRMQESPQ